MTSLNLWKSDHSEKRSIKAAIDWGTGKERNQANKSRSPHESGTFVYTGEPIVQTYQNTDIKLSKIRNNDELVPAPLHTTDITSYEIPLKFPSNHPFASHISEKSVFPTPSTDPNDRPSTYTDPYIVTHKTRGNPFRREVHYHGFQQERYRQLKWPDKNYNQLPRSLRNIESPSIYPWPRKMFAPNNESLIENSETVITNNRKQNTVGGANENNCFDQEESGFQVISNTTTALLSNVSLKSQVNETFESTKPVEDTQTLYTNGTHQQPDICKRQDKSMPYSPMKTSRLMSENEKLDDQMRNGTDYINLPAHLYPTDQVPIWTPKQETYDDQQTKSREIRFLHRLSPSTTNKPLAREHYANHQQMDAENRLQQLEVVRPSENINLLNAKFRVLQHPRHARPISSQYRDDYVNTFYDQIGTYVQERSGLYHTENYKPETLVQAMPELENYKENKTISGDENNLVDVLYATEQTQNRVKPALFQYRAIGDYQNMRNRLLNKLHVPTDTAAVDSRTQEGNQQFVQGESIYGLAYNTRKFLQENTLVHNARADPTRLMSTRYNNNLERVRSSNSYLIKHNRNQPINNGDNNNQEKTTNNLISPTLRPSQQDELYTTKYITEHTDGYLRRPTARVYGSPFKRDDNISPNKSYQQQIVNQQSCTADSLLTIPPRIPSSHKTSLRLPGPEVVARFIEPKLESHTIYQTSFKDVSYHEKMPKIQGSVNDNNHHFNCAPSNCHKQEKLIDLQDRWSKTLAQQQYHIEHPDTVPYIGYNTIQAKKEILIADTVAKQGMLTVR